jgi:FlaA1/EpsC-like NDP-sugar epimerase
MNSVTSSASGSLYFNNSPVVASWPGRYLIFGGTGSLGKTLVERLLAAGSDVVVFSRDEAKHFNLKNAFPGVVCCIGDIRDYQTVLAAIRRYRPTHIINAAALKQVPLCEEFPFEAVMTNILGAYNVVVAALEACSSQMHQVRVLAISTDKAVKPINAYGATKMLHEKLFTSAPDRPGLVFNVVRYGNVLESTGSVIPYFKSRLEQNLPLIVTDPQMTRFLMSLNQAVDLIMLALEAREGGQIFVPNVSSARIWELAEVMCDWYNKPRHEIQLGSVRPGEKLHEILISEEEIRRTRITANGSHFVIKRHGTKGDFHDNREKWFSSDAEDALYSPDALKSFLLEHGVLKR